MKLINHVLKIRSLVQQSIDNRFSKMGLKEDGVISINQLPESLIEKRGKLEDILNNHLEELKDYAKARQETINECTFTLFNRIAAIKVMEDKELFPEVIRRRPENGNKSFAHNLWLEEHPEEKSSERQGLKHFLQDKFNELGEHFPLYNEKYPYAIMPTADELYNILEAFNEVENDPDCGADIWEGDDILGWLYENFNATEKEMLKESGEKTEYDKVSLQSQVYTPQWVVKFLVDNTLGKLYLEMFPDSDLVRPDENGTVKYQIANAPKTRTREPKKMEELRVIDPACGSGNFLIYTFSLLYDMYVNQVEQYGADYSKRDIPKLIIENNIYGVDLDERAVQLSQIALYVKAREIGGRRAQVPQYTNVVSTHFFLPDFEEVASAFDSDGEWDSKQMEIIRKIWADLQNAYKFGTLVRIEEVLNSLTPNDVPDSLFADQEADNLFSFKRRVTDILREQVSKYCSENSTEYALTKANDAMAFLGILSMPFDVAVANPPYTDSNDFGEELKSFTEANYRLPYKFNINLYACFIKRCCELAGTNGKVGIIHPHTFMFIKTYEDVRSYILSHTHINVLVDYGLDRVNLFGPGILLDASFYTLDMNMAEKNSGIYFNITSNQQEKNKKESLRHAIEDYINDKPNNRIYQLEQAKLLGIKSYPFIYWISDDFRDKFKSTTIDDVFKPASGAATSNNNKYLRFWWEIFCSNPPRNTSNDSDWVYYSKGGPFNKWCGNLWLFVNWKNQGQALKNDSRAILRNPDYYFHEGVTYSASGSKGASFRLLPKGCVFDVGGASIFPCQEYQTNNDVYYLLGLLNSKLSFYIVDCLNPTVNTQVGDMGRIPYIGRSHFPQEVELVDCYSRQNVDIKSYLQQYSLIEPNFAVSPIGNAQDVEISIKSYYDEENGLISLILINEAIINETIFKIYNLSQEDRNTVLDKEGVLIAELPVSKKAKDAYILWLSHNQDFKASQSTLDFISALPEQDEASAIDNFESLYQNNNDWEEFCIKHNVNPIEAWWQFKNTNVLPPQRTQLLAYELITDVIRTVLHNDDDGVIPLVDKVGEEKLSLRIDQELADRGYNVGHISKIGYLLGGDINKYLQDRFFQHLSDNLNLFMYLPKTPFIWHLTSGTNHALELYISIYKWNRNTLFRIKSVYAANREAALKDKLSTLSPDDALAQMEANTIKEQLKELKEFVAKIDDLLASGYDPKLDDGVGKNIAPLQKRGMLAYEVLNPGQLKKYLNADW